MKISRAQIEAVLRSYRQKGHQEPHDGERGESVPAVSVEPELLAVLRRRVGDTPAVRDETVARLRELLSRNEYSVTADEIADLFLRRLIADRLQ